jgi:hypothetical protein
LDWCSRDETLRDKTFRDETFKDEPFKGVLKSFLKIIKVLTCFGYEIYVFAALPSVSMFLQASETANNESQWARIIGKSLEKT